MVNKLKEKVDLFLINKAKEAGFKSWSEVM